MPRQILTNIAVGLTILCLLILPGLFSSAPVFSAETCYEYYEGSGGGYSTATIGNGETRVQTFTAASNHSINKLSLHIVSEYGVVPLTVSILKCNPAHTYTGTVLSTATVNVPIRAADWLTIDIPSCNLLSGQSYAILAEAPVNLNGVGCRLYASGDTWVTPGSPGYQFRHTMGDWYTDPGYTFLFRLCYDQTLPSVITNAADPIGGTSATLNGNITNTGGENCDEQGFIYYSTTSHPTNPGNVSPSSLLYAWRAFNTGSFGTGAFSYPISLLSACTTYYFRAYAHNSQGWVYGDELDFITLVGPLPTVSFTATPTTGCAPLTVNFTGIAAGGTTWSWAFGDGNTSTFQSPTHQYVTAGSYTVTLTATNSCGSNSVTKAAYIVVEDCQQVQLGIGTGLSQPPTSHGTGMGNGPNPSPVGLPNLSVQSASISAKTVTPGTPITVTADIDNKSAVNGNKKVTLYVNGQVETTQGVTVNSGGSTQLTFNVSRSEPGDYTVNVDGVPAGSFKVELFRASDGILIFSAAMVGLAFILGMVMLWRRQRRAG